METVYNIEAVYIKEEPKDAAYTSMGEELGDVISVKGEKLFQAKQAGCCDPPATRSHCKSEYQDVIQTDVSGVRMTIKKEPVDDTEEGANFLQEDLDQVVSIKQERICQAEQENCHDTELFDSGKQCMVQPQVIISTDVKSIKQEPVTWPRVYDDELRTLEGSDDEVSCCNHNSIEPLHGSINSEGLRIRCHDLYVRDETAPAATSATIQGIDWDVSTPGGEEEASSDDAEPGNLAGSPGAKLSLQCDLCKRFFRLERTLRKHVSSRNCSKSYQCQVCNKQFNWPSLLTTHSRIHSGLKPYQCHVCYKQFRNFSYLTIHSRVHSGLKPYRCPVCGKHFSQLSSLNTHSILHSGVKPHECNICHKQFSQSSSLTRHLALHSGLKPYECKVCHKHFSQLSSLTRHSVLHSGLKPHECNICHKQFSDSSALTKHHRVHSGLKPYKCQICHRHFSQSSSLNTHSRMHSRSKPGYCKVTPNQVPNYRQ